MGTAKAPETADQDLLGRFRQWESSQPQQPNPEDYKSGILRKLFGGAAGFALGATGNPQIGEEIASDIAHPGLRQANANYNRAENDWQTRGKNLSEEEKLADFESQIAQREAQAKANEVVPFKLPDGSEINVRRSDVARLEGTLGKSQKKSLVNVTDPARPGEPVPAYTDGSGKYYDPESGKEIPGATKWAAAKEVTAEQRYSDAVADAIRRGADPAKDPAVMQWAAAVKNLHPQQPNFASIYPQIRGAEALEKPTNDYATFNTSIAATKANIADAQTGDQLANAIAPLGTALVVVGAGGVHRINMTEINRAGDPQMGSIARRVDAALEKAGSGKLPADTIKEMSRLIDMYGRNKYRAYLQEARSTAAYFKLDDPPVMTQDGDGFIPLSEALRESKMGGVKGGRGEQGVTVDVGGRPFHFPDQKSADAFKKQAGLH